MAKQDVEKLFLILGCSPMPIPQHTGQLSRPGTFLNTIEDDTLEETVDVPEPWCSPHASIDHALQRYFRHLAGFYAKPFVPAIIVATCFFLLAFGGMLAQKNWKLEPGMDAFEYTRGESSAHLQFQYDTFGSAPRLESYFVTPVLEGDSDTQQVLTKFALADLFDLEDGVRNITIYDTVTSNFHVAHFRFGDFHTTSSA